MSIAVEAITLLLDLKRNKTYDDSPRAEVSASTYSITRPESSSGAGHSSAEGIW